MLTAIHRRLALEQGLSLVEVLVAITVLTVALLAMAGVAVASLASLSHSKQRQQATTAVARALELTRAVDYAELAMRDSDSPPAQYDPDAAEPLAAETVVATPTGPVTSAPYDFTADGISVQTFVTWFDDPGPPVNVRAAKRITAVATWGQAARAGTVRQSTLVAETNRGLPEPAFDISPLVQSTLKPPGVTICFAHTLKNLGAPDRYDVVFPTAATHPSMNSYTVSAYIDSNSNGVGDATELMVDVTGDGRPDTPSPLATNATLALLVCYVPTTGSNPDLNAQVTVRSGYDSTVTAVVEHDATVSPFLRLWLHDRPANATTEHSRDCTAGGYNTLDYSAPTRATLVNYDRSASDTLPGLGVAKGQTACTSRGTLRLQFQLPEARTLTGQATLTLWTSWASALTGSTSARSQRLSVNVVRVVGTTVTTLSTTTLNYSHAQAGWRRHDKALNAFAGPTVFPVNSYLRLEVACVSSSAENCHLAYDTTTYPAVLVVQ